MTAVALAWRTRLLSHPRRHRRRTAGDDFTLADVQFGHVLFRYFDIAIPRRDRPALRRYHDALTTRPAFREHVSYEELRVSD